MLKEIDAKEEPSVLKEFYESLPKDGDEPKNLVDSSSTEEKETPVVTEDKKPDENIPFHKHPRWIKLQEEKKQQADVISKFDKQIAELREQVSQRDKDKVPEWFTTRFGEDPNLWKAYSTTTQAEKADIKKEIMAEIRAEQNQAKEQEAHWQNWVAENVQNLKDEGEKFDENALYKVMTDFNPTDAQGNLDFRKGLALLKQLDTKGDADKDKANARKEVAASTTSSVKGEKQAPVLTPKQLRKKSFSDLAHS